MTGPSAASWAALDAELAAAPGIVSVYVGRLDAAPAYTRLPTVTHYAASTMKVAVLAALYREAEAGRLDLDAPVAVRNRFASARPGAPPFHCDPREDNDPEVWARLGGTASLAWLARRMIVRSANLATNLVLAHVGLPAVARVWATVGARGSRTGRGIADAAAREAGIDNRVTAADLAALLGAIATGALLADGADQTPRPRPDGAGQTPQPRLAGREACAAMLDLLLAQQVRDGLTSGLPGGVRAAYKNGWVRGVRHVAGVVFPEDAPPYLVVVCTSRPVPPVGTVDPGTDAAAHRLIARVSSVAWALRDKLVAPG